MGVLRLTRQIVVTVLLAYTVAFAFKMWRLAEVLLPERIAYALLQSMDKNNFHFTMRGYRFNVRFIGTSCDIEKVDLWFGKRECFRIYKTENGWSLVGKVPL